METLGLLAFAFLGGLVLNVMPCVLPVLALKAFSALDHSRADPRLQRRHGLAYSFGTISALTSFGLIVIALRNAGTFFGWGMQFQHPGFVAAVTAIIFAFGLNALGVFEVNIGLQHKEHEGLVGSMANGWLAAIMATPCSAPFLGSAAAFAMASNTPAWLTLSVFVLIGAGLAFPFALLSWVPALARRLPRPGEWMESVKMIMGFTLLGTAVWLFRILLQQVATDSAAAFLAFLVVLAAGLWGQQRWGGLMESTRRRWTVRVLALAVIVFAGTIVRFEKPATACMPEPAVAANDHIPWIPFDAQKVQAVVDSGKPVFLDFTAEWCVNCKTYDALVIDTKPVREALKRTGVVAVKVDMTNMDETESAWLVKVHANGGLPAYVLMTKKGMDILPETVPTQDMIISAFDRAVAHSAG